MIPKDDLFWKMIEYLNENTMQGSTTYWKTPIGVSAMSTEELEAARESANIDYAPDISYDDWQAMAKALLAHIDDHEAYIASLKGELEIAGQRLREMSLKKDEFALMQALETRKEQIEALMEKLIVERSRRIYLECQGACGQTVCAPSTHRIEASQQLKADPDLQKAGVEWE